MGSKAVVMEINWRKKFTSLRRYTCHFCYFSQYMGLCSAHSLVHHQYLLLEHMPEQQTQPHSHQQLAATREHYPG